MTSRYVRKQRRKRNEKRRRMREWRAMNDMNDGFAIAAERSKAVAAVFRHLAKLIHFSCENKISKVLSDTKGDTVNEQRTTS